MRCFPSCRLAVPVCLRLDAAEIVPLTRCPCQKKAEGSNQCPPEDRAERNGCANWRGVAAASRQAITGIIWRKFVKSTDSGQLRGCGLLVAETRRG